MPLNANSGQLSRAKTFGGFTASGIEYDPNVPTGTPGTAVAPTDFVPGKSNTLGSTMASIDEMVENNSSFANAIHEPTIETSAGVHTYALNTKLGLNYYFAGLGNKAAQSAVTQTSTGSVVTAAGISTIPVTGAYVKGRPVIVGTGANSEVSIIYAYSVGSLQVFALKKNAAALTGLSVVMPAETKFANSLMSAGTVGLLPLLTVEKNSGGDHSFQFPSVLVESLDFTMGTGTCEVAAGLYATQPYNPLTAISSPTMAAWNPSTGDYNQAIRPFTALNAMVATYTDIDGTGSKVQAAVGIKSAKVTYNNNLVKEQVLGNSQMQAWASANVQCDISYTEIDTARYNALYENAVRLGSSTDMYFGYAKNLGTNASPVWTIAVIEIPFATYTASTGNDSLNQTSDHANVAKARVLRGNAQDMLVLHLS